MSERKNLRTGENSLHQASFLCEKKIYRDLPLNDRCVLTVALNNFLFFCDVALGRPARSRVNKIVYIGTSMGFTHPLRGVFLKMFVKHPHPYFMAILLPDAPFNSRL